MNDFQQSPAASLGKALETLESLKTLESQGGATPLGGATPPRSTPLGSTVRTDISFNGEIRRGAFHVAGSFQVQQSQMLGIRGANGAGKTTLLLAIAGLVPLSSGNLILSGEPVDNPATKTWVRPRYRNVGFAFQEPRLLPHLTALNNVAFGLRARGINRELAKLTALRWLQKVGLESHAWHKPDELSGGQAQRVALARALSANPDVLLLDEPFSSLDADARQQLLGLLQRTNLTTLLVSHDMSELATADRLLEIGGGKMQEVLPI